MPIRPNKEPPHKALAKRLEGAIDARNDVPLPNYGRLRWFTEQLEERFGISVKQETVRKWLAGEALPRHKPMRALAQILNADEAWLAIGKTPELDERQQILRNAEADGAVNVVAGFIQMCGETPAFPDSNDQRAKDEHIDIYATIKGKHYDLHVAVATQEDEGWRFTIPTGAEKARILGVIRTGPLSIDILDLDTDALLAHGQRKGAYFDLHIDAGYRSERHVWRQIRTFATRL